MEQLIKQSTVPPSSLIHLLNSTLIGTKGTLYRLLDTDEKVKLLHQPKFVYLERNGKVLGNVTFCKRSICVANKKETAFYIRYVAFKQQFQSVGKARKGNSALHTYFRSLLSTSNQLPKFPKFEKSMYWAYIDPENLRSLNLNSALGFQTIGSFKTTLFSRVNPKNTSVERIKPNEKQEVLNETALFYKEFAFYSSVHLFKKNNYFVLKENGQIICGIQANPVHWRIENLPGIGGKFMLQFAHKLPRLKKLINPKNHRFLATEGLFWKKGYEGKVEELLEGVLKSTKQHSLLIMTDENNPMLNKLKLNWGFLQRAKKDNLVKIVAKFNGYNEDEIKALKSCRKYLSGFDIT